MKYCIFIAVALASVPIVARMERDNERLATATETEKDLNQKQRCANERMDAKHAIADSYILGRLTAAEAANRFSQIDGFDSSGNKSLVVGVAISRIRHHDGIDQASLLARIEKDSE